jgi:hypothetical protein
VYVSCLPWAQHRLQHPLVTLPEIGQERARTYIKQAPPLVIDQVRALTSHDHRKVTDAGPREEHILSPAQRREQRHAQPGLIADVELKRVHPS